ncbi:DNA polymerase gamma [Nakaseomyces bracarensis]|uniref:DNA polymerase gamma n=1 Tax=Nakaseomyces bracarensis TaxID=273131 RepID=A0ABR4NP62_9SACH
MMMLRRAYPGLRRRWPDTFGVILRRYSEVPRTNPLGIQYLSESLQKQVFPRSQLESNKDEEMQRKDAELVKLAKLSLKAHDLLGKSTTITTPISFKLPELQGQTLDEHFQKLGHFGSEPYRTMATNKFTEIPSMPEKWLRKPGWYKYEPGKPPREVKYPEEETIVFDVETLYKISPYPTLATAVSEKAWYLWCSPYISGTGKANKKVEHLIPLDTLNKERLIIGHNVGYDRSRVLEEYNLQPSKAFFLDTLSLHVASAGLCSRQRPFFLKNKKNKEIAKEEEDTPKEVSESLELNSETDPWLEVATMNSLADVALFHCGIKMDKTLRDYFAAPDKQEIIDNFDLLVKYCAGDVVATSKIFDKLLPSFLEKCPHPVSFAGLKALSSCVLPTDYNKWQNYIKTSEGKYQESKTLIEDKIVQIIEDSVNLKDDKNFTNIVNKDPWLRQLNWDIKPLRLTKKGVPSKGQKLPGFPEWYRSLFPNKDAKTPQITMRSRIIPLFFKLSWENSPVIWTDDCGWCFSKPRKDIQTYLDKNYKLADEEVSNEYFKKLIASEQYPEEQLGAEVLFKVPHPNGPANNCTTLLSKPYVHFFEKGILQSQSELASMALKMNAAGSYWMSARERIMSQFVVPKKTFSDQFKPLSENDTVNKQDTESQGIIIPNIIPMGTVTRRAVESTWLTASNAKKNRIGSELKAQISAPKGYSFVGADVDSEELWIASLFGDSVFKIHGGTAIGWMCLEGTKKEGTDLHTKTANILNCDRNEAKIFNYGRIYGAGVKFAAQLLKQFNPSLSEKEAKETAVKLYESTKGKTKRSKIFEKFWYGGSESILFNKLESIAEQRAPMTPVLGCGITNSLVKKNLRANSFLPSRINWAIQSSGVDYLHLLCCSMNYLIAKYNLDARLTISIHDEIRYLVADKDKYKLALALQISNLWTRAMFSEQMGIFELPQNCAFFSAIDIDHVLRKEVDLDCVTPSNETPIPHGESIDIVKLLERPECALENPNENVDVSHLPFKERTSVFAKYNGEYSHDFLEFFLRMQIQTSTWKVAELEKEYILKQTENELKKKKKEEYGFLDYIADVKKGKRRKMTIMDNRFSPAYFRQQKLIIDKKLKLDPDIAGSVHDIKPHERSQETNSGNYSLLHEIAASSTDSKKNPVLTTLPEQEAVPTSNTMDQLTGKVSTGGRRRKYKTIGGKSAYDAFYASIDESRAFANEQERIITEIIEEINDNTKKKPTPKRMAAFTPPKNRSIESHPLHVYKTKPHQRDMK